MWLALAFFLISAAPAAAADYQQCSASSSCTIGEWLYDDNYQPQSGAVCTLTAKYPDGSDFLSASASATSDGWYYYTATIGTTTGVYRANLCCTSGSDYLCLDKSFEVKAATTALTAADVWSYSSRTLTGFGSLAADIWNNSTRSLTTFGDLVANIWNSATFSTTSGPGQTITTIVTEQTKQRELLEKLVNEPVVSLSLEEGQAIPNLNVKLEQSRQYTLGLYELIQDGKISGPDLLSLTAAWEAPIITELNLAAQSRNLKQLARLIGKPDDNSRSKTLFGFLAAVSQRQADLEGESQKLAALLDDWNGQGETRLQTKVKVAKKDVLALNDYPGGDKLISSTTLKNLVLSLRALLGLNQQLLAVNAGDPIRSLWLEEGSIIFRGVITNPSTIISQTVPLKFYLPRELKTEDIISLDQSLETHFDPTEEALYVSGSYTLAPEETRLVVVEVQDIWKIDQSKLDSIKNQTAELLKPLEKTALFSQGTVLKTEIGVTLDKIALAQTKAITPENRIRAYREARLELNGVDTNIKRLQDLVAQASSTGSLFGFVGGVQAVAVWGILIIVIAGFVFLTFYMRQMKFGPSRKPSPREANRPLTWDKPALIPLIALVTAVITVLLTQWVLKLKTAPAPTILPVSEPSPSPSPLPPASPPPSQEIRVKQEKQVLGEATPKRLSVPQGGGVNIRSGPAATASALMTIKTNLEVFVFEVKGDWSRVGFSSEQSGQNWWVSSQFLD